MQTFELGDRSLKTLKMALLGATFLIGAAGAASAADLGRGGGYKDGPAPEYQQGISWTGFYFGANAGASFSDVETEDGDESDAVFVGGLHVGYNWQKHGPWVFGIEGDVGFADDIEYIATLRGRLGYAAGSTLIYATGGAAFLGVDDASGDDDETITGWVAGGGLEHKLRENVSIGVEGLYYSFDGEDFGVEDENADTFTVRARLTYHLGGGYADALK